jgi:TonB-linked SusC/RagA family outer membrane protein
MKSNYQKSHSVASKGSNRDLFLLIRVTAFLSFVICLLISNGFAHTVQAAENQQQTRRIVGTITDQSGNPLPGVSIIVKGTTIGIVSGSDGKYALDVPSDGKILVFSFIGMASQETTISGRVLIDVVMVEETTGLDEVVVVGYGTQKKVNLTGAVDVADGEKLANRQAPNVSQALQGVLPGLNISINNNYGFQPGATMDIDIRGIGSLNGGNPYVLIDGVPDNINNVNPEDIKSISVLKDAASSAIYGSRAPYGVILITTKRGEKNQRLKVNYTGNFNIHYPHKLPETVDSYLFARVINEMGDNRGGRNYDESQIDRILAYKRKDWDFIRESINSDSRSPGWPEGATIFGAMPEHGDRWNNNVLSYADNNWFDIHYGHSTNQKHNLSLQGGTDRVSYYFSTGYLGEKSVLVYTSNDFFNKINVMGTVDIAITDWWNFTYNTRMVNSVRERPNTNSNYDNLFTQVARTYPIIPLYDGYGNYHPESHIAELQSGTDRAQEINYLNSAKMEIRPLKGWKINADFSYNTSNISETNIQNLVIGYHPSDNSEFIEGYSSPNEIEERRGQSYYWTTNIYSSYDFKIKNNHNFMILGGMQFEKGKGDRLIGYNSNMISESVPSLATAIGSALLSQNLWYSNITQGYFLRLNYNYSEKYLLEMNTRYDGSYVFREGNRWGLFPSFSLGWNIHREPFWENIKKHISIMKLRGSWGQLGNQQISPFTDIELIGLSLDKINWIFNYGDARPQGFTVPPSIVNKNLIWETATTKNVGVDISFLNNRLQTNFDLFERLTTDMVGPAEEKPGVLGEGMPRVNNASLRTRGWELSLGWNHTIKSGISYFVDFNLSDRKSVVTKYYNPEGVLSTWYEGAVVGEIWGYTVNDLFRTEEELSEYLENTDPSFLGSNWTTGDVRYEDTNNDNKVNNGRNTLEEPGDRSIIGNSEPRYQVGISAGVSFKGFDLSMLWSGVTKRDLWFPQSNHNVFWGVGSARHNMVLQYRVLDYFRDKPGDKLVGVYDGDANINLDSYWPRPYLNSSMERKNKGYANTRYLQDGSYLRLQNVKIGYSLPRQIASKLFLQNLNIYLSGENLITLQKLPDCLDPAAAVGAGGTLGRPTYGADRIYSFGVIITY